MNINSDLAATKSTVDGLNHITFTHIGEGFNISGYNSETAVFGSLLFAYSDGTAGSLDITLTGIQFNRFNGTSWENVWNFNK